MKNAITAMSGGKLAQNAKRIWILLWVMEPTFQLQVFIYYFASIFALFQFRY